MPDTMTDAGQTAADFDLEKLPSDFFDDPFPTYSALQRHQPLKRMPNGSYFATRYSDCQAIYKDARTFSSDKKIEFKPKFGDSPLYDHHTTSLVFNDAPLHTRVRKLIMAALTSRVVASMEPGLITLVDRLLDDMEQKATLGGRVDIIEDFASAIPIEIIGNLLDVPMEDRGPLRGWSLAILGALEPRLTPEQFDAGNRAVAEFLAYLEGLVADRRKSPGDPATDVLTRLIVGEIDGETLQNHELLQNCIFILNAGHETTTNLIGNGIATLALHDSERARLLVDHTLISSAIEEVLRFESPNQIGNRRVIAPTTIGGVEMPIGTLITTCIAAANRDPEEFPNPERFDVGRTPNRHLAFASGVHNCAGLNIARMEGRIAISAFLKRFPNYTLDGQPVRSQRARFRGFNSIPVRLK
jgi:cytochrome P450